MEFRYTGKDIARVKKRRFHYERKWRPFYIIQIILLCMMVVLPIILYIYSRYQIDRLAPGFYTVDVYTKEKIPVSVWSRSITAFCVPAFLALLNRVLVGNMTSHWVSDRFDEKLYVENGRFHHTYHYPVGGGALSWTTDNSRIEEIINVDSIHNLKIDSKSGRIEFLCTSSNMIYSDWEHKVPQHAPKIVSDFKFTIYDFFQPSLITYLKGLNISYIEGPMKFKVMNGVG